jgi:hypothetical protein
LVSDFSFPCKGAASLIKKKMTFTFVDFLKNLNFRIAKKTFLLYKRAGFICPIRFFQCIIEVKRMKANNKVYKNVSKFK